MPAAIATIGYEGLPPAAFLAALREAGITRVIDVRALASSRRPGYAKRALAASLEGAEIEYRHLPALGTPKAGRDAGRAGRHAELRRIFAAHLAGGEAQQALALAASLAHERPSALLCLEAEPAHCHRCQIAEALAAGYGFAVCHLRPQAPDTGR